MSEFVTSLLISGGIFAMMMLTQFGRRAYKLSHVTRPVIIVGVFAVIYLRDIPLTGAALVVYGAGIAIGAAFAAVAVLTTKLERTGTGFVTVTGLPFLFTWLVAMLLRVGFVWAVDNVDAFRNQVGEFMINTGISVDSFAPFFVLMALTMVLGRVIAVAVRAHRLAPQPVPAMSAR
ncbi:hypothetical protein GIS00_19260 [Nakamurella sp. YIM 132087]|uniref:DUF1453 domain-containing protein n=1 Tax=Nakamurella alba TaxID=2665158 RepID=A0A7K1FPT7_9ACTN|nr:hypothetical protein [Nakamurella alba]MTD16080.1 hypothetical protein [Nakamurella alba]